MVDRFKVLLLFLFLPFARLLFLFCFVFTSLDKRKQDRNLEFLSLENVTCEHWPESPLRWCWWQTGGPAFKEHRILQQLSEDAQHEWWHSHSQGFPLCSFLVPYHVNCESWSPFSSCHSKFGLYAFTWCLWLSLSVKHFSLGWCFES